MQLDIPTESTDDSLVTTKEKKSNELIIEEQNFILGCDEMERITDDIIVPTIVKAAEAVYESGKKIDVVLMDCESPFDSLLYNCGVRFAVSEDENPPTLSIVGDPSSFLFTLSLQHASDNQDDTSTEEEVPFYELTPRWLSSKISQFIAKLSPKVDYDPRPAAYDLAFDKLVPPFTVRFDDGTSVSDVAKTQTLKEAAKMGATFAEMFKDQDKVSIVDSSETTIC